MTGTWHTWHMNIYIFIWLYNFIYYLIVSLIVSGPAIAIAIANNSLTIAKDLIEVHGGHGLLDLHHGVVTRRPRAWPLKKSEDIQYTMNIYYIYNNNSNNNKQ
jgi:hypothetical protein